MTARSRTVSPNARQRALLRDAARRCDARLPLFTRDGQIVSPRLIASCIACGWAEPWFAASPEGGWLVCRVTEAGRAACA